MLHARTVGEDTNGKADIVHIVDAKLFARLLIVAKLNPLEGHITPLQEIADRVSYRAATLPIEADRGNV
jgi:hypothetical protein